MDNNKLKYCVYVHKSLKDNRVFYVGSGSMTRPYCKTRSKEWFTIADVENYNIEIVFKSNDKQKVEDEEARLINQYKRIKDGGTLVNKSLRASVVKGIDSPHIKPVICLDINGKFIKEYEFAGQAELDGFSKYTISKCCRGNINSHKDHIFIFKHEYDENINYSRNLGINTESKAVIACTRYKGKLESKRYYESTNSVRKDGYKPSGVSNCLTGKIKTYKGFIWIAMSSLTIENQIKIRKKFNINER